MLRRSMLVAAVSMLAVFAVSVQAEEGEWKSLFNGKDLSGWDGDPRIWSVKDGAIRGESTDEVKANGNTFLIWQGGKLKDFDVKMTYRCTDKNNSGIQYRSRHITEGNPRNAWIVRGYQYEIRNENKLPSVSGFIYDEGGKRGRTCLVGEKAVWTADGKQLIQNDLIDQAGFEKLFKLDDWNEARIVARGNHIQHYINGKLVLDFTDEHPEWAALEGILAIQLHAGAPMWLEFKDILLKELK